MTVTLWRHQRLDDAKTVCESDGVLLLELGCPVAESRVEELGAKEVVLTLF